jgi:hypothetical protein
MPIEYLDASIANEGIHAERWTPPEWANDVAAGEEWQPDIEAPRINDYAAFKKHKHYGKYFRAYRFTPYPMWLYHPTLDAKIVQNRDEVVALGPEWSPIPPAKKAIVMVGKALPIKTDTQRLAEAITLGLAEKQPATAGLGAIDPTVIAAIVAAVLAATQRTADPVVASPSEETEVKETQPHADTPSIERLAMLELAEKEGIKIDKRWGDAKLKEALGL